MWFAAHVYVTFDSITEGLSGRVFLEESVILLDAKSDEDVFNRLDELKEMLVAENTSYPGYKYNGVIGIRKVVSVLNMDGSNISLPSDKSEITYELYEFKDKAAVDAFIKDEYVEAKMDSAIKR